MFDICYNVSSFDPDDFPHNYQALSKGEGAFEFLKSRMPFDIATTTERYDRLPKIYLPSEVLSGNPEHWRRLDNYLWQSMSAYIWQMDLCSIVLSRAVIEHVLRDVYRPAVLPNNQDKIAELVRKLQERSNTKWLKDMKGEMLIDNASKVAHFNEFTDLRNPKEVSQLSLSLLEFVNELLRRSSNLKV
ncbi:MAG TPA: hypothetical protein ACFE0H_09930 [Elainellaceae cyanobacterium]